MDLKVIGLILCVTFAGFVTALPFQDLPKHKQDLVKTFVEFIQDDKELGAMLNKLNAEERMIRNRRQVEDTTSIQSVEDVDVEVQKPKDAGFFDRAAKFVMEVLQRFLKWINSDN